jgi:predicted MFS family arabinose efflux permease
VQGPTRIYLSLRHHADAGLVAAVAATTLLFAATPFLLPEIASEYGVQLGMAGLVSTAQVGTFAVVVFVAGRTLRTRRLYLIVAALIIATANLASAVAPTFAALVALRMLAGGAAGIMVWLGWAKAMRVGSSLRNVAAAGPAAVFLGAPVVGWLASTYGIDAVFMFLAVVALPAAVLPVEFAGFRPKRSDAGVSRSNVVLVVALGLVTLAGSALFVYTASLGQDIGMGATAISLTFSANALAGFIGAQLKGKGSAAPWIAVIAVCVVTIGFVPEAAVFVVGLTLWGLAFWIATPRVMSSIADWSPAPEDRVGDAQSAMAVGRAMGPAIGGVVLVSGSFSTLAIWSVSGLLLSAAIVFFVDSYRRGKTSPTAA